MAASWIYDFPQVISIPLMSMYKIPEDKILLCYTFYSIPNLFFVFIGGFVVNKYGAIVFLLCILIAFFGNSLFCLGILFNNFPLMLVGRVFVGMGSETGITASYYILSNYIDKGSLRMYNAFIFVTCTAAAAGNLYIAPKLWLITRN